MRERASRAALLLAIVLLGVGVGFGAPLARADDAQKARELFTQGNTYFDLGQFDKAIDAWQSGYQLKNDPGFLYNIAQAYRTMGDAQKAIFFYKRYLSNAPKAHNRSEVDQKIEALQKQLSLQEQAKGLPPPGPFGPDNPVQSGAPTPTEPPPATGKTGGADGSANVESSVPPVGGQGTTGTTGVVEAGVLAPSEPPPHRVDLRAAIGLDSWSSGLQENAQPSFAFALAGGYAFGPPQRQVRFRLGALLGYTFLRESASKENFTSLVIDPTILVRVTPHLQLMGDIGIGFVSISGLKPTSALLDGSMPDVNGSPALFLFRVGVGAEIDLAPTVSLFVWPAVAASAKRENFYSNITRVELLAGVAYRP